MNVLVALSVICFSTFTLQYPVGQCPEEDGPHPVYLPDSKNCSHFYECSDGKPYIIYCPPNTAFDNTVAVCVYSPGGRCLNSLTPKEPDSEENKGTLADKCPKEDGIYPTFLINPNNCSQYYECSHGIPFLIDCPRGEEFNAQKLICDLPENAGCSVEPHIDVKCPEVDGHFPTFLVDPDSCSRYYQCSQGRPILLECPAGLEFNRWKFVCDLPEDAGCSVKQYMETV